MKKLNLSAHAAFISSLLAAGWISKSCSSQNSLIIKYFNSRNYSSFFYIHCSVHQCNCFKKITNTMSLVDYPLFSWVVVIHSLHVSSFQEAHHQEIIFPVQSASGIVYNLCYSKDYTLYQWLTVQEKWSPDDELPESSKHVENEWRLPMKIKDSPQVTSCWFFFKQFKLLGS